MLSVDYPELATHQQKHAKLLVELRTLIPIFGDKDRDLHELVDFLMEWFINHTLAEDKKVVDYLQQGKE